MIDYVKVASLERYLFEDVGQRFRRSGKISAVDFYLIIIWKANRAKTRERNRLVRKAGTFAEAVKNIAKSLRTCRARSDRLEVLMRAWGFRLPMASAVLTVLYPEDFTIYDVRVCNQLGKFEELYWRKFSDGLWSEYNRFLQAVKRSTPAALTLRDKDRYLWGRSLYAQARREVG